MSYQPRASKIPACNLRREIDGLGLDLLQRILLLTDGTLTPLLEMYAGEEIEAVKLCQELREEKGRSRLPPGRRILVRTALLRGRTSLRNLVHAESTVFLDRLDRQISRVLLETNAPIGRLLQGARTETFREVLGCGREPAGPRAEYFLVPECSPMIYRTSRIWSAGALIMAITERFPETQFRGVPRSCT
jgi:chorismate-pyruvate lyase